MSSHRFARAASFVAVLGSPFAAARAQGVVWESRGEAVHDFLGKSVDLFGDLDGDGKPEILAGAPEDKAATLPGRAFIFGSASGSVLREWSGTAVGDDFGIAVSDAGDVDGDGVDDVIVGVPGDNPTSGGSTTGAVRIFSGATGALILQFAGASGTARFGAAVEGPGDLDGDGRGDIVANSYFLQTVYAYSGASGASLWQYSGGSLSGAFGWALDTVGDLDGDGTPDLVIGAQGDHSKGTNHGAAYLLSGRTGSLIRILVDRTSEDTFGAAVSGAGDVDGDGTPDVLVGNPGYSSPVYGKNCGAVTLFSGATGAILTKRIDTTPYVYLGTSVSECGDLDGDGFADFAAGEGLNGGSVFLYSGKSGNLLRSLAPTYFPLQLELTPDLDGDGTPDFLAGSEEMHGGVFFAGGIAFTFSGANASAIQVELGTQRNERRGEAVAVLADIDGDSWRDVLVGSPSELRSYNAGNFEPPGSVSILSGRDGSELRRHDGAQNRDNYGERIVAIPDFTGDGVPEYAIAAPGAAFGTTAIEVRSGADGALIYSYLNPDSGKKDAYGNDLAAGKGPNGRIVLAVADTTGTGRIELYDMATGGFLLSTTGDSGLVGWGACVSFIGDVDGDGEGDWIGGAPAAVPYGSAGSAILFSGATGAKLRRLDGSLNGDWFGYSVSGIGDLDGDGVRDLIVGAPDAASYGPGKVYAYSGATGALIFTVAGNAPYAFGQRVASLGDVNGDGIDDFAASSLEMPGMYVYGGRVYVFSGRTHGLLARFEGTDQQNFGQRVASAASGVPLTVDLDPIPDLLTGAPLSYVPSDCGDVKLLRLDDLMLQADPSSVAPGAAISIDTRGGPAGSLVGLFAVDFSGVPLDTFVAFGTFDTSESWSLGGTAPPGLSGNTLTLRSYAIGYGGKLVDSQDATITFE